ncbi:HAD family hydrolase [Deinococcus radiophilus]|uniref:Sucrose phosphatase-like domain-containing protein n=1 Tax=Deinococcus radiophilus TaxID=32062 RepID=A0A431VUL4_9DEIO|nr:HAD family hydrolase [Deinococcus radiophilus]RTR26850.1 hypothetical protein EJ104_07585 [Deinococcus radiophilus]UFA51785.1 hypothetical protein LMT64_13105 [Deinococcus radiophilus]
MTSQIVAFADLDDTVFQTLRKLPGADSARLTPATVNTAGEPHSFMTPAQTALLDLLAAGNVTVIPVTGRDPAAFARVGLEFPSWRVLDHGLTILDAAGEPEQTWATRVRAELEPLQAELGRLTDWLRPQAAQAGARLTVHHAHDLPFMTVLKHPEASAEILADLQDAWTAALPAEAGLTVIANANNVSLLPAGLGKAAAVRYLRQTYFPQAALTLGLGDSVSDLGFMAECDFALTPTAGQLMRTLRSVTLPQR